MGTFRRNGVDPLGNVALTTIIPATAIPAGNALALADIESAVGATGTDTHVQIEVSTDGGFTFPVVHVIELPAGGTFHEGYGALFSITGSANTLLRVRFIQGVADNIGVTLVGTTLNADI